MDSYRRMTAPRNYPKKCAFTLIELLTVVAIIGVLAAILIPVVGMVRHKANSSTSLSNLRQIGNAVSVYTTDMKGNYPLLNRRSLDNPEKYFWPQALEEKVLEWDRTAAGKHPIFEDPTASKHHGISDYGGNMLFFGDGNESNQNRVDGFRNIFKVQRPSSTVIVATAHHPSTDDNSAAWLIAGSYAATGSGTAVPEARLNSGEVGLVFVDGHAEIVMAEKLEDDEYRLRLFNPEAE